jgi:hypothetical protein
VTKCSVSQGKLKSNQALVEDGDAGREQHFLSNNISAMAGPLRWERLNE